jgi:sarcosine oxidase
LKWEKLFTLDRTNFDVIVLGVGSMGASTCYHLAERGLKVLGIEQFDIPHERGSHTGQSRIIRKAYGESTDYVPLLTRAYENWKNLESETGVQVYYRTGLVYFGSEDDAFLTSVKYASRQYNVPVQIMSKEECNRKYPQFSLPRHFQRLEEPEAGFIIPERAIQLYAEEARLKGAVIRTREEVLTWNRETSGSIKVITKKAKYLTKKLVITAGPWSGKLIPGLASKLNVTRQVISWVIPKKTDFFSLWKFPCWLVSDHARVFYGFPILPDAGFTGPKGLKLAMHLPEGDIINPDEVDRAPRDSDKNILIDFLNQFIPDGYECMSMMKTCLYTNSPDHHFIIDFADGYDKDVVFAAGFSGHGFKFVSVVGEILSDLIVTGWTELPVDFLKANRFK